MGINVDSATLAGFAVFIVSQLPAHSTRAIGPLFALHPYITPFYDANHVLNSASMLPLFANDSTML